MASQASAVAEVEAATEPGPRVAGATSVRTSRTAMAQAVKVRASVAVQAVQAVQAVRANSHGRPSTTGETYAPH